MFDYQEKQQIKQIMVEVLRENGLISCKSTMPKGENKGQSVKSIQPSVKLTAQEEKLYAQYREDAIEWGNMNCCDHNVVMSKDEWCKRYRLTGSSWEIEPSPMDKMFKHFTHFVKNLKSR